MPPDRARQELLAILSEAQARGFVGPAPLDAQVDHALAFASAAAPPRRRVIDLGSGGGLPGLVLATLAWPAAEMVLVDAQRRRAAFLDDAIARLGAEGRVTARHDRAETLGREPALRGQCDRVVARSFGPPAVTAECAAPLLERDGLLVVSEPPRSVPDRWPNAGLAELGLTLEALVDGPPGFAVLRQAEECSERFPRRVGVPERRPLWSVPS